MVAIVGVGETDYSFNDPRPPAELAVDAIRRALEDAGLSGADVDGFVIESMSTSRVAPVDQVAQAIGATKRRFTAHGGIAGAGIVGAPQLGRLAIDGGLADVVVCYYAINLSTRGSGGAYAVHAEEPAKAAFEMPFGLYGQPVYFALSAALRAERYGLSREELGAVAVTTREHATRTPNALRREPLTIDAFLAERYIAEPLSRSDCCLVSDGGVAFVMTSSERARDLPNPPAVVAGVGMASKPVTQAQYFTQSEDLLTTAATESGRLAFEDAGLSPVDVDVAEIYDCFTVSVLMQLEDLGFVEPGGAGHLAIAGGLGLGARCPVNTHGGLLAQSYLVGANHVVEAVRQIRGTRADAQVPNTQVALVAGLGVPEHATLILTVDR